LNNRAENSHLPTRKREPILQRFNVCFGESERRFAVRLPLKWLFVFPVLHSFKSVEHALRFLVPFNAVSNHFRPRRHRLTASTYRQFRAQAHAEWQDVIQAGVHH